MTREEKDLLLKDLCARLPYGVIIQVKDWAVFDTELKTGHINRLQINDIELKPYLRPMSSMTGVEVLEYISLKESIIASDDILYYFETYESIDWLNKNHFDYRGLIEKGLAIDATNLNIY